jgi:acetyl-CoA C-acetyltransferase
MTTLVNELERTQGRFGILAICEGGGTANATIIERIPKKEEHKVGLRAKL